MTRRAATLGLSTLLLGLQIGCAAPGSGRGELLQQMDQVLQGARPSDGLALTLIPEQALIGQQIALQVRTPSEGFLYVFQLTSDGQSLSLIFPNARDTRHQLTAGKTLLPRDNWRLVARGPAGVGYVLAVLAQEQQDQQALLRDLSGGRIRIRGAYRAVLSPLTERLA